MKKTISLMVLSALVLCASTLFAEQKKVGAVGRIVPLKGLISLSGRGDVIVEIMVKDGDRVTKGTPLIVFEDKALLEADLAVKELDYKQADGLTARQIELQRLKIKELEQSMADAIQKQTFGFKKAKLNYELALDVFNRLKEAGEDTYSAQQSEQNQHRVTSAEMDMHQAAETIRQLERERALKLELMQLELKRMIQDRTVTLQKIKAQVKLTKERLAHTVLRAPDDGTIIKIHHQVGERTGGVLITMSDISRMAVIAEVFQGDLLKILPGKRAMISSNVLPYKLYGKVERIGRLITNKTKNAQVTIILDDPKDASRLINHEVSVSIDI